MRRVVPFLLLGLAAFPATGGTLEEAYPEVPRVEFTPFYGWQFGGGITFEAGDLHASDAPVVGGILSYRVEPQGTLELLVSRQRTDFRFRGGPLGGTRTTDTDITYWQFGGIREVFPSRVRPFVSASLGLTYLDPADGDFAPETRFSFTLGGGLKAWWTRNLGVRVQATWLATVIGGSASIFCGAWGCYTTLSGEMVSQGSLTGGLVFGF